MTGWFFVSTTLFVYKCVYIDFNDAPDWGHWPLGYRINQFRVQMMPAEMLPKSKPCFLLKNGHRRSEAWVRPSMHTLLICALSGFHHQQHFITYFVILLNFLSSLPNWTPMESWPQVSYNGKRGCMHNDLGLVMLSLSSFQIIRGKFAIKFWYPRIPQWFRQ